MKKLFVPLLCLLLTASLLALPSCKKEEPYDPDPDRALVESYAFTVSSGEQTVTPMRFIVCSEWGSKDGIRTLACGGSGFGALYDTQKDQIPLIPELKLDGELTVSHNPNFTVREEVALFDPNGSDDETVYIKREELSLLDDGYYYVAFSATAKTEMYEQTEDLVFKLIVEKDP